MVALIFPGQGSQYVGMGRDLVATFPEARHTFEEADDTLGFPLTKLAWDGPDDALTATSVAQPAIMAHSIAVFRIMYDRLGDVAYGAGHSLGEFTAYVAAGSMSFADALRTVRLRGELMQNVGEARPGAMAALLGLDEATVERVCAEASASGGTVVPANFNSPAQLVISGDSATIDRAIELAKAAGSKHAVRLNVSGAFHSPLMQPAARGLADQLESVQMSKPSFPVISNVTAEPVSDVTDARRLLIEQLTSAVHWTASVNTIVEAGVRTFYEIGPGHVLTKLLKRIDRSAEGHAIGTSAELEGAGV